MTATFRVLKQSDGSYNGKMGRVYQDRLILQDDDTENPLDVQMTMELRDEALSKHGDGKLKGKKIKVGIDNFRAMNSGLSVQGTILEVLGANGKN